MKIFNIDLKFRVKSVWSDKTIRLLPKQLGLEFKKGTYIKTKSSIEPWYWYVSLNLIWIKFTLFCDVDYRHIFKLKV
jgi:hypothetical protein